MNSQHLILKKVYTGISCVFINLQLLCRQKLSKTMKGVGRSEGKVHLADWTCHHWIIPCSTHQPFHQTAILLLDLVICEIKILR